jgi:hypothetical protein
MDAHNDFSFIFIFSEQDAFFIFEVALKQAHRFCSSNNLPTGFQISTHSFMILTFF